MSERQQLMNTNLEFSGGIAPSENIFVDDDSNRCCWVCFGNDEDDLTEAWVKPCRCKGTTKWVHQSCIQRWVDEKQRGNWYGNVACPQCNTEYVIVFPDAGKVVVILDTIDNIMYRACPFFTAIIVLGSSYWSAVSYGALTIVQLLGPTEGAEFLKNADAPTLGLILPSIPVILVSCKLVCWDDYILHFLRRQVAAHPFLGYVLPLFKPCQRSALLHEAERARISEPVSLTREVCSALFLPTAAALCGHLLFESVSSNLYRTVLGGLAFIGVNGMLRIYHKQQQLVRQSKRSILDFTEPDADSPTD